jgi:hypothetical protein
MKDPVLIKERQIIKEQGLLEAVKYLSLETKKHPQFSELFFKYYFRSMEHSINVPELHNQIEPALVSFLEYYEKKKEYPEEYRRLCDLLFKFAIAIGDGDKANCAARRLTYMMSPDNSSYLLIYKDILDKAKTACLYMNIGERKKDIEYMYNYMMVDLLDIAWHLFVDFNTNMLGYEVMNFGYTKPSYRVFEIYNNMKWRFDIDDIGEDSIYDVFSDYEVERLKRLIRNFKPEQFVLGLQHLYFDDFPTKIGFNPNFLDMGYDDLKEFGRWFTKKDISKENFSSIASSVANKLVNDFLKNHI